RIEYLQTLQSEGVFYSVMLHGYARTEQGCPIVGKNIAIFYKKISIIRMHAWPSQHKHVFLIGVVGEHCHFGDRAIVVSANVGFPSMLTDVAVYGGIESTRFAPARHIHADGHVGPFGVVHYMYNIVVIEFGLITVTKI